MLHSSVSNRKVLVFGEDNSISLTVVRSLGRHGVEVHGIFCPPSIAAVQSKYLHTLHENIVFAPDSKDWKPNLIDLLKKEQFDLIIPCEDTSMYYLRSCRDEISRFAPVYLPDDHAYEVTRDKRKTYTLAQSLGVPVPRQVIVQPADRDIHERTKELGGFPLVVKPFISFNKQSKVRNFVKKAYSPEELEQLLAAMPQDEPVIIQQNIIGVGVGVELLMKEGITLVTFQHVRVHEPLMGGGSSYRKSAPVDPALLDASQKILAALRYTGVAMVEFKVNPKTGQWVLIEINGRFWGSLPLPVSLGMDFPYWLYRMLVHDTTSFPQTYRSNVYCRNTPRDWLWMRSNYHADKTDPTLATEPVWKVYAEFLNILLLREKNDTLVLDDPKPGIIEHKILFTNIYREYHDRFNVRRARKRTQRRFRTARSVLFVCKGNICRSPFAEYLTRKLLNKNCSSAGYYPYPNRTSPAEAIRAGKELEVDMTGHRSKIVNKPMIRQADIVLVFDKYNYETLVDSFPFARKKISYFGYLSDTDKFVDDPFGKDISAFRSAYTQIHRIITRYVTT